MMIERLETGSQREDVRFENSSVYLWETIGASSIEFKNRAKINKVYTNAIRVP
jgi:hypothetical protein